MIKGIQILLAFALLSCVSAYPQHGGYHGGYGDESSGSYADGGVEGDHVAVEGDAAGGSGAAYGDSHGHDVDYHAPAHYAFEYDVHDPHTGDVKSQHEERKGDDVKGFYTLKEADGTIREVHYTADKHNGFNAVVKRTGHASHPQHYKTGDDH